MWRCHPASVSYAEAALNFCYFVAGTSFPTRVYRVRVPFRESLSEGSVLFSELDTLYKRTIVGSATSRSRPFRAT
jgi:hypothetical protein